jgi:Tol biopolymer transport system component
MAVGDRDAAARPVAGLGTDAMAPSLSRTANGLAYHEWRSDHDIWRAGVLLNSKGRPVGLERAVELTGSTRPDLSPQVAPDGRRLVFVSRRGGDQAIWVSDIDGRNALQVAAFRGYPAGSPRWAPDGKRIAFDASPNGRADVFVVGANGGQPRPLTSGRDTGENIAPSWSRDAQSIYFASNRTGRYEVWNVSADGGTPVQLTRHGGLAAFESHDRKFVYYTTLEADGIWRMPAKGGQEVRVLEGPPAGYWGHWALLAEGIYFVPHDAAANMLVEYFDFETQRTTTVGRLDAPPIRWNPYFAASPDGRSIFYVKAEPPTSDIMLVRNFR